MIDNITIAIGMWFVCIAIITDAKSLLASFLFKITPFFLGLFLILTSVYEIFVVGV